MAAYCPPRMATCVNPGRDFETSHDKPFPKDGGGKTLMAIHLWFWLPTLAPDKRGIEFGLGIFRDDFV